MKIGCREPAFPSVKKSEAPIEQNVFCQRQYDSMITRARKKIDKSTCKIIACA
jgi:hypothetical protein